MAEFNPARRRRPMLGAARRIFAAILISSAVAATSPAGEARAQSDGALEAARVDFARHYQRRHADFICRPDGAVWRLDAVDVDWVGEDVIIGERLRVPGETEERRDDHVFLVMSHVSARATIHRRVCAAGVMFQVEINCLRDCKIRLNSVGLDAARGGAVDRSQSYGGVWWFEYRDERSAREAVAMIERLIPGLPL